MKAQKIRTTIAEIVGILLTIVMLAPFLLVIINSAKDSASIVISPISLPKNWGQLFTNMSNVIHNDNFNYWGSFFSSLLITAVSLILLTLFSSMAAWVLVRNKTKWSNFIWEFRCFKVTKELFLLILDSVVQCLYSSFMVL